jgi:hypothetical protein
MRVFQLPINHEKTGAPKRAQVTGGNKLHKQQRSAGQTQSPPQSQRPKPADCIACREMSDVDAIPCIRSLNSSAFEALSSAVS